MKADKSAKSYTLRPGWKYHFWAYLLCIMTIPLAGIGLVGLYYLQKKRRRIRYIITDTAIEAIGPKIEQHVDLIDITNITLQKNWLDEQLHIGSLVLQSSTDDVRLNGLDHPARLKALLEKAITDKLKQQKKEQQEETKPRQPDYEPGQMQHMEYLTGLWQQGLISEEEYQKERNNR